ncbi:MAG: hypothetical protein IPF99_31935 [Deltaproteobacteria bacterium]|nr:hypothetical protein [Deltaproteobacteria bacterium]
MELVKGPEPELTLRRGLLLVIAATALTGVLAGLGRLGVLVAWGPRYAFDHGPLLVLGTFGTVIALERAVALGRPWAYVAPVLGAVGAVATLAGIAWAPWAATASALALVALNAAIVRKQAAAFTRPDAPGLGGAAPGRRALGAGTAGVPGGADVAGLLRADHRRRAP